MNLPVIATLSGMKRTLSIRGGHTASVVVAECLVEMRKWVFRMEDTVPDGALRAAAAATGVAPYGLKK